MKNLRGYAFRQSMKDTSKCTCITKNGKFITILNVNTLKAIQSKLILRDRDI